MLDDLLDRAAVGAAGGPGSGPPCTAGWPVTSSGCRTGSGSCRWSRPSCEAKRERGVIDFADQMQIAATLVRGPPADRQLASRDRYRVVLLDEYQDTGHAQRVILRTLFGDRDGPVRSMPIGVARTPVDAVRPHRAPGDRGRRPGPVDLLLAGGVGLQPAPVRHRLSAGLGAAAAGPAAADQLPEPGRRCWRWPTRSPAAIRQGRPPGSRSGSCGPMPTRRAGPGPVRPVRTVADEDAWLAGAIAGHWREAMDGSIGGSAPPTTAVLLRRRSDMADTADALRAAGLPVEVVGLGGLLDEPEVADLVATLRVLVDPTAGAAAIRLLTGARWQLGAADLEALARRARELPVRRPPGGAAPTPIRRSMSRPPRSVPPLSGRPWPPPCRSRTSTPGRWSTPSPISDRPRPTRPRVTGGSHASPLTWPGCGVGWASHCRIWSPTWNGPPAGRRGPLVAGDAGRAHLDAFAAVVAEVAATGAGPGELLEYLDAAAEREDGLSPGRGARSPPVASRS